MKDLVKGAAVLAVVWCGLSIMRAISDAAKEEDLARLGAGESDFQRKLKNRRRVVRSEA